MKARRHPSPEPRVSIRFTFYGAVKDVVGESNAEVMVPQGATLRQLLQALTQRYGQEFAAQVLRSDGGPQGYVRLFIGDEAVDNFDMDTGLISGDTREVTVLILPTAMGGQGEAIFGKGVWYG
jgi:molybdopterin converting factor small subunit